MLGLSNLSNATSTSDMPTARTHNAALAMDANMSNSNTVPYRGTAVPSSNPSQGSNSLAGEVASSTVPVPDASWLNSYADIGTQRTLDTDHWSNTLAGEVEVSTMPVPDISWSDSYTDIGAVSTSNTHQWSDMLAEEVEISTMPVPDASWLNLFPEIGTLPTSNAAQWRNTLVRDNIVDLLSTSESLGDANSWRTAWIQHGVHDEPLVSDRYERS